MRALLITLVLALAAALAMAEVKVPAGITLQPGTSPVPSPRSGDFPCPTVTNCGVNCVPSGGTTVDTGERSCRVDDNTVFHCLGTKTIHVTSGSCHQAPCCNEIPACLCGPCGGFQTWTCA